MKRILIFAGLILYLGACKTSEKTTLHKTISVSIVPQTYFVKNIAGDGYKVNVIIPPGASPEIYEAGFRQLTELSTSDLYLKIGHLSFEEVWMKTLSELNPKMQVFDISDGIKLLENNHEHNQHHHDDKGNLYDPHIWMSAGNAQIIAHNSLKALQKVFPEDSALFLENYTKFQLELEEVNNAWFEKKDFLEGKSFLIYHPALSYLANEMNMEQISLEFEGKEPPSSYIQSIIKESKEKDIRFIFIQKQFNPDNARSLAEEIGAEIIIIDPLTANWKEEMMNILNYLTM